MEITNLSPIEKWQSDFEKEPLSALDNLLRERVYMGKLNRNETSEILFRLFHTKEAEVQRKLDRAMRDWFRKYWMAMPPSVSSSQWAEILQNAFISVHRLNLCETYRWLSVSYFRGCSWLRSLYLSPARDPEAALLQTLALCQQDQSLLPLWIRLCRMEEDLPIHYTSVGLLGLRKLPGKDGKPPGDLEPIVFKGIVDLAEAINNRCKSHEKKQGEHFWILECRAIMALYPRSTQYWIDNFSPLIHQKSGGDAAKWFNKTIPDLLNKMEHQRHNKKAKSIFLSPPSTPDREKILRLLKEQPLDNIKLELHGFLEKHRRYAYQTGDSGFLAKTFNNIGNKIFKRDTEMALALVEEAFLWEPYNPFTWTERAKIEVYRGNYSRSIALLWEAKRRFPGNPHIRTSLANILGKNGEHKIAEIIYRQAIVDFPDNVVCRTGLAEVLKAQNKLEDAEEVYLKAIVDFPDEVVCRNGLAEVLKAQNRLEEAEEVYLKAIIDFPDDVFCRTGLAEVLKAQEKLEDAEEVYLKAIVDFPDNVFCRTGLAEVLKAQEKLEDAEEVYLKAIVDFPDNVFCRTGLAGVLLQRGKRDEAIAFLEETVKAFPHDKVAKEFLQKVKAGESLPDICEVYKEEFVSKISEPEEFELGETPLESASSPSPAKIKIGLDEQKEKESSVFETTGVEKKLPDEDNVEKEIGMTNLYRLAGRMVGKEEEKEVYKEKAFSLINEALRKTPDNIPALLENGWLLLDESADNAKDFFSNQLKRHPHVLGLHVGNLRYKGIKEVEIDSQQWVDLINNFSGSSTVIKLEHTLHELTNGNGTRLTILENLRKQLARDTNQLPFSLQENEKWAVSLVKQSLFENISISETLTEDNISHILNNHKKHGNMLKGIVEQCVNAI